MSQGRASFIKASICMLLALLGLGLTLGTDRYLRSQHPQLLTDLRVQNNETVHLLGTPGKQFPLQLSVGQSPQGLWASPDGLHLVLDGTNLSTVVVPPKALTWKSETFENCENCNDVMSSMLISGLLTIPPSLRSETQTIKGKLTGTILYPADADDDFANTSILISIALQITVISAERYTQLLNREDQTSGFLTLINFVFVLPLLIATIIFTLRCRRHQR